METIGRKIEQEMELMLQISNEVASMQGTIDSLQSELAMYETLHDINKYLGSNLELVKLIPMIEDSIVGILGVNYCRVLLDEIKDRTDGTYGLQVTMRELDALDAPEIHIKDLGMEPRFGTFMGTLLILRMDLGYNVNGYLIAYWAQPNMLNESRRKFAEVLSIQTCLSIKSARLIENFKSMAIHDPLTKLYNRSYFTSIESTTIPRADECLIMLDVDHFKNINDSRGHAAGDDVLRSFADILRQHCNDTDTICYKYGGEEFVVKCNAGEEEGYKVAESIRTKFETLYGYTVSTGIATIGKSCKIASYDALRTMADSAMYISKQTGRNRTTISNPDILIFEEAKDGLCALMSRAYRAQSAPTIIRIKVIEPDVMSPADLNDFKAILNGTIRLYDKMYVTNSLESMIIIEEAVEPDVILNRIDRCLRDNIPNIKYDIHVCNELFNEVMIHSSRVSELAQVIGYEMGLSEKDTQRLRIASEWHDIGKMGLDPMVYHKPGRYTPDEFNRMKLHAWFGYSLAMKHKLLQDCGSWILYHHENYDGSGYFGLQGDDIPIQSQIMGIADKFDALTENRCYRKAYTWKEALDILYDERKKFNGKLFMTFNRIIKQLYERE